MINSNQFANLFIKDAQSGDFFIFDDGEAVGFSLLKEYPETGLLFQPVRNQKGEIDSVAFIKIYFVPSEADKDGFCPLFLWIGPSSRYLVRGNRARYNYEDKDSPSFEALNIWNKSVKPVELVEIDYIFNTKNNKILNKKTKKEIKPELIIESVFKDHLKTAKRIQGIPFRIKLGSQRFLVKYLIYLCKGVHWICRNVFSRDINKDNKNIETIAYELFLKPVPHKLFVLKQQRELNIFGTSLPVSKHSVVITPFLFVIAYIVGWLWLPEFKAMLDNVTSGNAFLATSILIIWFVVFDNWLPNILFFISNMIVRLTEKIKRVQIKI